MDSLWQFIRIVFIFSPEMMKLHFKKYSRSALKTKLTRLIPVWYLLLDQSFTVIYILYICICIPFVTYFYHISVWREYCVGRWVSLCPGSQLQVIVMGLVRFVWQVRFCGASGGSKGKKKNKVIFKWNLIWSMYKRIANASHIQLGSPRLRLLEEERLGYSRWGLLGCDWSLI